MQANILFSLALFDSLWSSLALSDSLWLTLTQSGSLRCSLPHKVLAWLTTLWLRGHSLSRPGPQILFRHNQFMQMRLLFCSKSERIRPARQLWLRRADCKLGERRMEICTNTRTCRIQMSPKLPADKGHAVLFNMTHLWGGMFSFS